MLRTEQYSRQRMTAALFGSGGWAGRTSEGIGALGSPKPIRRNTVTVYGYLGGASMAKSMWRRSTLMFTVQQYEGGDWGYDTFGHALADLKIAGSRLIDLVHLRPARRPLSGEIDIIVESHNLARYLREAAHILPLAARRQVEPTGGHAHGAVMVLAQGASSLPSIDSPSGPPPAAEEGEQLVEQAELGPEELGKSRGRASARLREAVSARSQDAAIWLTVCARLRTPGIADIVEEALRDSWSQDVLFAAVDAAWMVPTPADVNTRLGERLCLTADGLLESAPYVAARALMGSIMLLGGRGWALFESRLPSWPVAHLQPAMKIIIRQLSRMTLVQRKESTEARSLSAKLPFLLQRARARIDGGRPRFALADGLLLVAFLTPLIQVDFVIRELLRGFRGRDPVVRAGAALGLQILGKESPASVARVIKEPQGERLLQAAFAAPSYRG